MCKTSAENLQGFHMRMACSQASMPVSIRNGIFFDWRKYLPSTNNTDKDIPEAIKPSARILRAAFSANRRITGASLSFWVVRKFKTQELPNDLGCQKFEILNPKHETNLNFQNLNVQNRFDHLMFHILDIV